MMNLLNRQEKARRGNRYKCREERGDISSAYKQLLQEHSSTSVEKEEIIRGDIQEAINNLLKEEGTGKRGHSHSRRRKGRCSYDDLLFIQFS